VGGFFFLIIFNISFKEYPNRFKIKDKPDLIYRTKKDKLVLKRKIKDKPVLYRTI
jgi:hypothetical protein